MVQVGGQQLYVHVRPGNGSGPADTPPLLMCNGLGASLEVIAPLAAALDPARTVITFDAPGVGRSPAPTLPYSLSGVARLAAGLLDRLGHRVADVLGFSWGGGVAQQLALHHPRRVRRMVLLCSLVGAGGLSGSPAVLSRLVSTRRHHDPEYAQEIAGSLYGGLLRRHPERAAALLGDQPAANGRGYVYQLLASSAHLIFPFAWLLRQPTLLLFGDDDPICPAANARLLHSAMPHARLHVFGGGHLDPLLEPERFAARIDAFLSERAGSQVRGPVGPLAATTAAV